SVVGPTPGGGAGVQPASPTPAAAQPRYGGVVRFIASVTNDYANLDPHRSTSSVFYNFGHAIVYSRLVKPGAGSERTGDQVLITGDAAERWEQADDQTYVFKMRPGVRFQNIPPLNGRTLVAQDVQYSFERQK